MSGTKLECGYANHFSWILYINKSADLILYYKSDITKIAQSYVHSVLMVYFTLP